MYNKAIVFNCHYNGLSIIQDLGRKGVPCIAMDTTRSIGTYSRYAKYVSCSDPATEEDRFVEELYNICAKEPIKPVLFPTNDIWVQAIAKHQSKLSEVSILGVPREDKVNLVLDKQSFYEKGAKLNFLTPRTYSLDQIVNGADIEFPIIAKPNARRISSNAGRVMKELEHQMDRLRLTQLDNVEVLQNFLIEEKANLKHLIFQQLIPGLSNQMFTIGIYANKSSDITGIFTGRKVRGYPAEYGDCIVGEVCSLPDELIQNTIKVVQALKYTGIAEFEYKRHAESGDYYLIEINPRSWSWIGITPACEVSLPWIAYTDLVGLQYDGERNSFHLKEGDVKYVKYLEDFDNCINNYKLDFPNWSLSIKEWKRSLKSKKLIKAEFSSDDILVAVVSVVRFFTRKIKRKIRKLLNNK